MNIESISREEAELAVREARKLLEEAERKLAEARKPKLSFATLFPGGDEFNDGTTVIIKAKFARSGKWYTYAFHKVSSGIASGIGWWISTHEFGHLPKPLYDHVRGAFGSFERIEGLIMSIQKPAQLTEEF